MTETSTHSAVPLRTADATIALRIAESALTVEGRTSLADFRTWFDDCGTRNYTEVDRVPLDRLANWSADPVTGNIGHVSGKFFVVEGLEITRPGHWVEHWAQPIINQPEIGILGIVVKEFDGVLHCLMQGKVEPGNCNGVQLSPTVQATRSNYTRVHKGKPVPYLDYFMDTKRHKVIADVLQSEQGSWFFQKRNRNMVVEVTEDVELLEDFCWLTLGQLHQLLGEDDLVNMDARTVLSCLPFSGTDLATLLPAAERDAFTTSIMRSCTESEGAVHTTDEILSWITGARTRHDITANRVPLKGIDQWKHTDAGISHVTGRFFNVIGVDVRAGGREVLQWSQPMLEPSGDGLSAFLVKQFGGVLHALVHARVEPGYLDVVELAPTVQCTVDNYMHMPPSDRLPFLDALRTAPAERIRYDTMLSEEGGRFYHARTRYLVVETEEEVDLDDHPDHRWLPLHQLVGLLRHSHYVNVQARSLVACMHSLFGTRTAD